MVKSVRTNPKAHQADEAFSTPDQEAMANLGLLDYANAWADTQGLDPDELSDLAGKEVFFSVDLEEATYRIPFEILDENVKFCDEIMSEFRPWNVYRDLFSTFEREVDMTELVNKGYWDGPLTVTSSRGSFMGDGMSFIHLTLMLSAITSATFSRTKRPLGQSVGDDLFLMKTSLINCLRFCKLAESIGCKFSKLNSISEDSLTFCENYCCIPTDIDDVKDIKSFEDSCFGDTLFLDIIKGSALSGQAKVKVDGADPFIGHASLLAKQVKWHPLHTVASRAKTILWARNYRAAMRLSSSMASLPQCLGGAELAVGPTILFSDKKFQEDMLPWYEGILRLDERDFLEYYLLLRGIYQSNPKGFAWQNDIETIREITKDCELYHTKQVDDLMPDWLLDKSTREKLAYIEKELGMISFHNLAGQLARREAFLSMWNLEKQETFMTFLSKDARQRANKAWAVIKSNITPIEPDKLEMTSMGRLTSAYQARTWGLYVLKNDPSIRRAFGGMPDLFYQG
ncbi:RNA dependent RNA polymerase [Penicillium digitatum narna-like virus 1]|uniref:RNA dependent RNA polymerase n=1 Tax=Penicillium digitatum narna-like virus 1 TaxID=2164100 RepID=UPI000D3EF8D1|nr:RNA dependent RNA polymerase [Penicillium digitatum narna-like virus 1]AVZ65987.1 RNA dependent RNA polymerase [Penicillium digitatum narna-like virus 1]